MDNSLDKLKRSPRTFFGVFLVIVILFVLKVASEVTLPLVTSLFLFLLCNPLLDRLDKLRTPRWLSTLIVMLLLFLVFIGAGWFMVSTVDTLIRHLPSYANRFILIDNYVTGKLTDMLNIDPDTTVLALLDINWIQLAMNSLTSLSGKLMTVAKDAALIYIFIFFLLLERQSLVPKLRAALPTDNGRRLMIMLERVNRQVSKYLVLKLFISVVTGVMYYFAALLTHLDFPVLWGVLACVINFIPAIGSVVVTTLVVLMSILQFFPIWPQVIYVAVLMISIEMVMGNIIDPRLQGVQLNLSPFVILVSLSLWGYIWGIMGMLLAVPLTSVIQIVCANVKSLRPVAIALSSGKTYRRQYDERKRQEKRERQERQKAKRQRSASVHKAEDDFSSPMQEPPASLE
ncbi:AI-2E family transporter [Parasphaerochaeta coccoides]|nr:AI-2E family transporter [Parasphaerochaeta coccoides]